MLVDAALVVGEVRVHGEGGLDRAVVHNFHLDLLHILVDAVGAAGERLVLVVGDGVAALAGLMALGRGAALGTGAARAVDVVLARLDLVRLTSLVGAERSATDETGILPESPSGSGKTAVTSEAARVAARQLENTFLTLYFSEKTIVFIRINSCTRFSAETWAFFISL